MCFAWGHLFTRLHKPFKQTDPSTMQHEQNNRCISAQRRHFLSALNSLRFLNALSSLHSQCAQLFALPQCAKLFLNALSLQLAHLENNNHIDAEPIMAARLYAMFCV